MVTRLRSPSSCRLLTLELVSTQSSAYYKGSPTCLQFTQQPLLRGPTNPDGFPMQADTPILQGGLLCRQRQDVSPPSRWPRSHWVNTQAVPTPHVAASAWRMPLPPCPADTEQRGLKRHLFVPTYWSVPVTFSFTALPIRAMTSLPT